MISVEELNHKELEILQGLADGERFSGLAKSLKLSESTVAHYTLDIRLKLDAPTTPNAIAIALRRGLID